MNYKDIFELDRIFYRIGWIFLCLLFIGILIIQFLDLDIFRIFPPCIFYYGYGFYCPGCGGTRSIVSLLKGNLVKSFLYHPVTIYTVFLGGWFMITQTLSRLTAGKIKGMSFRVRYIYFFLILLLLNFLIKNVLVYLNIIN